MYPSEIDKGVAYKLGRAFAVGLKAKKIVVGRDKRSESDQVLPSFVAGASSAGCQIQDLGVCSTAELSFAVGIKEFDGGVIATASHNPVGYAGFKMFNSRGLSMGKKTGLKKIIRLAQKQEAGTGEKMPSQKVEVIEDYARLIGPFIKSKGLKDFKLVFDISNGSGGKLVRSIFSDLPSKSVMINLESDDKYPDHGPNPMLEKNRQVVMGEVKKQEANLGVIFDGDADRCIFIDENGQFVEPYYINCLLSQIILNINPGVKVLIDARMPVGPGEVIERAGGKPVVSRSGTANFLKTMRDKKIIFGCENSGHYFFNFKFFKDKKNFVYEDSVLPIILILGYLVESKRTLSEAVAEFKKEFLISGEINLEVDDFDWLKKDLMVKYGNNELETIDGLSVYGYDPSESVHGASWFFNVRPSHTEPLVRLNIEAKNEKALADLRSNLENLIN